MHVQHIKNAYGNIKNACMEKLNTSYPAGIPDFAMARFEQELSYLDDINLHGQDHFEVYRLLCEEAKKTMHHIEIMDLDASSFIVFLLGNSIANPLPPHYYCHNCGHFELVETRLLGIDLPHKNCPNCNSNLKKDGNNFHQEFVWNISQIRRMPNLMSRISEGFFPHAQKVLEKAFPNNEVVPLGSLSRSSDNDKIIIEQTGFLVLPDDRQYKDFPHFHGYLEDGTPCMYDDWYDSHIFRVELKTYKPFDYLMRLQAKTSSYLYDMSLADIENLSWTDIKNTGLLSDEEAYFLYYTKPKTFTEMSTINALTHNSYDFDGKEQTWTDRYKIYESEAFKNFPCCTRDDFFEYAAKSGLDYEKSYYLANALRRGIVPKENETLDSRKKLYQSLTLLPADYQEIAVKSRYLCPRSLVVQNVFLFAKLAYYLKLNSKIYGKIVFQDK